MKKLLLPFGFICLFLQTYPVFAQHADLALGVEIGGGIRSLHGNFYPSLAGELSTGAGMAGGVFVQKYLSHDFSIKTSLLLAHKGATSLMQRQDRNRNILISRQVSLNFTYIKLPVLFRYERGQKIKYFVNAGPYLGTLIRQHQSGFRLRLGFSHDSGTIDWGLSSGIGCQIPLWNLLSLTCEIRNDLGIHDISKYTAFGISPGPMRTQATNLFLGISWELE